MSIEFVVGQIYNRRRDIHDRFGGQRQSGICMPANHPAIFLFTGRGTRHGYADEWSEGTFRYFGEGQKGDMTLTKGNKAIADHAESGRDLLLFEMLGRGQIQFRGPFNCAGYSLEDGKDQHGANRKAIVFHLVPISDEELEPDKPQPMAPRLSLQELRSKAFAAAGPAREAKAGDARRTYYVRSGAVRGYVLARANGVCEACDGKAPFRTATGAPYLEPHHIRRLTDGGPDDARFMGAVCPNCHREIHHGENGQGLNEKLQARVTAKEASV